MTNLYDQLGAENLKLLVDDFYNLIKKNPITSPLFKTDINEVKRKQTLFLTQFLGGQPLYSQEFGHPRMRMRHLGHRITAEAAIEWLKCMDEAIAKLPIDEELKANLFRAFPKLARHMVNS